MLEFEVISTTYFGYDIFLLLKLAMRNETYRKKRKSGQKRALNTQV